jgi:hypothetical protein
LTTVILIADLVEANPLPADPYLTRASARLMAAYQHTNIKRVELLFNHPPLAEMLRLCPRCQDNNDLFNYLYLNKLQRELRAILTKADRQDRQALGTRADTLAYHLQRMAHDAGTAVAAFSLEEPEDEPVVAAVKPGGGNGQRGGGSRQRGGRSGERGGGSGERGGGADSEAAEAESEAAEADSEAAEADSKAAEADSEAAEADSQAAEADSEAAEADSKAAEADSKAAEADS